MDNPKYYVVTYKVHDLQYHSIEHKDGTIIDYVEDFNAAKAMAVLLNLGHISYNEDGLFILSYPAGDPITLSTDEVEVEEDTSIDEGFERSDKPCPVPPKKEISNVG